MRAHSGRCTLFVLLFLATPLLAKVLSKTKQIREEAFVCVPVTDLTSRSLSPYGKNVKNIYEQFAFAPHRGFSACLRVHQLLFNQRVIITNYISQEEVECLVPGIFFLDNFHIKRSTFWMLKKDLVPLKALKKGQAQVIPTSAEKFLQAKEVPTIVLKMPWFDALTKRTYSAGTRFVRVQKQDAEHTYGVAFFDHDTKKIVHRSIPKRLAMPHAIKNFEEARTCFIALLKCWAHLKKGFIPYVYGGASFRDSIKHGKFTLEHGKRCSHRASFWQRPGSHKKPLSGFDCSNMILSAAQVCQLPYFYKNTRAIVHGLAALKKGEKVENGDLVWYENHVLVISDLKKNLCIEAVGYDSGYGKVHEIPLERVFKNIKTYAQLIKAHHEKRMLQRLTKKGIPYKKVYRMKILKLKSILPAPKVNPSTVGKPLRKK